MKKTHILMFSGLIALSLTSCNPTNQPGNIIGDQNKESSIKYTTVNKEAHQDKSIYYARITGSVTALGGMYNQEVYSSKIFNKGALVFNTITTGFVSNSEQRYENAKTNQYYLRSGHNPVIEEIDGQKVGSVSKWDDKKITNKDDYLKVIGHTVDSITNYRVDADHEDKFFTSSSSTTKDETIETYSYTFSLINQFNEGAENNADNLQYSDYKYMCSTALYAKEMNHMSGYNPVFKRISFEMNINKETNRIISSVSTEEYSINIGIMNLDCISILNTTYNFIDDIKSLPSDLKESYDVAVEGLK